MSRTVTFNVEFAVAAIWPSINADFPSAVTASNYDSDELDDDRIEPRQGCKRD